MPFAAFAPVTFLSAMTKRRLGSLMPLVMRVASQPGPAHSDAAAQRDRARRRLRASRRRTERQAAAHLLRGASRDASAAFHLPLQRPGPGEVSATSALSRTRCARISISKACPLRLEFRARRDDGCRTVVSLYRQAPVSWAAARLAVPRVRFFGRLDSVRRAGQPPILQTDLRRAGRQHRRGQRAADARPQSRASPCCCSTRSKESWRSRRRAGCGCTSRSASRRRYAR